jgi:hypothetical protein
VLQTDYVALGDEAAMARRAEQVHSLPATKIVQRSYIAGVGRITDLFYLEVTQQPMLGELAV